MVLAWSSSCSIPGWNNKRDDFFSHRLLGDFPFAQPSLSVTALLGFFGNRSESAKASILSRESVSSPLFKSLYAAAGDLEAGGSTSLR